jgi:hypothetical protein
MFQNNVTRGHTVITVLQQWVTVTAAKGTADRQHAVLAALIADSYVIQHHMLHEDKILYSHIYIYIYVYIHIHTHTHTHIYTHTHTHN